MKTKFEEQMELIFNTDEEVPMHVSNTEVIEVDDPEIMETTKSSDSDYEYARENIKNSIEELLPSLERLNSIADLTEQPRAYEVLSSLFKSIVDANKDLLELEKKHKEMDKENSVNEGRKDHNNITNALFVGSTQELKELLDRTKSN